MYAAYLEKHTNLIDQLYTTINPLLIKNVVIISIIFDYLCRQIAKSGKNETNNNKLNKK